MASVNETVEQSLRYYPELFQTRLDVLHDYFCDTRSGRYSWWNGEIMAAPGEDDEPWSREIEERIYGRYFDTLTGSFKKMMEDSHRRAWAHNEKIVENAAVIAATVTTVRNKEVCPPTATALLLNIPADVTPDWAAAAEEIRVYVREHGWTV